MKKIIEFKNLNTGSDWIREEIQEHNDSLTLRRIQRLRADEKVNKHDIVYRIRSINNY